MYAGIVAVVSHYKNKSEAKKKQVETIEPEIERKKSVKMEKAWIEAENVGKFNPTPNARNKDVAMLGL